MSQAKKDTTPLSTRKTRVVEVRPRREDVLMEDGRSSALPEIVERSESPTSTDKSQIYRPYPVLSKITFTDTDGCTQGGTASEGSATFASHKESCVEDVPNIDPRSLSNTSEWEIVNSSVAAIPNDPERLSTALERKKEDMNRRNIANTSGKFDIHVSIEFLLQNLISDCYNDELCNPEALVAILTTTYRDQINAEYKTNVHVLHSVAAVMDGLASVRPITPQKIVSALKRILFAISPVSMSRLADLLDSNNSLIRGLTEKDVIILLGSNGNLMNSLGNFLCTGKDEQSDQKKIFSVFQLTSEIVLCDTPSLSNNPKSSMEVAIASTVAWSKAFKRCRSVYPVIVFDFFDYDLSNLEDVFMTLSSTFPNFTDCYSSVTLLFKAGQAATKDTVLEFRSFLQQRKIAMEASEWSLSPIRAEFFEFVDFLTDQYMNSLAFMEMNFVDFTTASKENLINLILEAKPIAVLSRQQPERPVYTHDMLSALKKQFEVEAELISNSIETGNAECTTKRFDRLEFISGALMVEAGFNCYEHCRKQMYTIMQKKQDEISRIMLAMRSSADPLLSQEVLRLLDFITDIPEADKLQQKHSLDIGSGSFHCFILQKVHEMMEEIITSFKNSFTFNNTKASLIEARSSLTRLLNFSVLKLRTLSCLHDTVLNTPEFIEISTKTTLDDAYRLFLDHVSTSCDSIRRICLKSCSDNIFTIDTVLDLDKFFVGCSLLQKLYELFSIDDKPNHMLLQLNCITSTFQESFETYLSNIQSKVGNFEIENSDHFEISRKLKLAVNCIELNTTFLLFDPTTSTTILSHTKEKYIAKYSELHNDLVVTVIHMYDNILSSLDDSRLRRIFLMLSNLQMDTNLLDHFSQSRPGKTLNSVCADTDTEFIKYITSISSKLEGFITSIERASESTVDVDVINLLLENLFKMSCLLENRAQNQIYVYNFGAVAVQSFQEITISLERACESLSAQIQPLRFDDQVPNPKIISSLLAKIGKLQIFLLNTHLSRQLKIRISTLRCHLDSKFDDSLVHTKEFFRYNDSMLIHENIDIFLQNCVRFFSIYNVVSTLNIPCATEIKMCILEFTSLFRDSLNQALRTHMSVIPKNYESYTSLQLLDNEELHDSIRMISQVFSVLTLMDQFRGNVDLPAKQLLEELFSIPKDCLSRYCSPTVMIDHLNVPIFTSADDINRNFCAKISSISDISSLCLTSIEFLRKGKVTEPLQVLQQNLVIFTAFDNFVNFSDILAMIPSVISQVVENQKEDCPWCGERRLCRNISTKCTHGAMCCQECIEGFLSAHMDQRTELDNCKCPSCDVVFTEDEFVSALRPTKVLYDRASRVAQLNVLRRDPTFRGCARAGCNGGVLVQVGMVHFSCIDCTAITCIRHECLWHEGLTCVEYDEVKRKEAEARPPDAATEAYLASKVRNCPKCHTRISKNDDGECDAMTCCQFGNDQCLKNRKNGGCNHGGALYCGQSFCFDCEGLIDEQRNRHHKAGCKYEGFT